MDHVYIVTYLMDGFHEHKRVYANKGAGGVDSITINELEEYIIEDWNLFTWDFTKKEFVPVTVDAEELFEELFGEFNIDKFIKTDAE